MIGLTADQHKELLDFPPLIDSYAEGYQAGRLHSIARFADIQVWTTYSAYAEGYRHGWRVQGRPV